MAKKLRLAGARVGPDADTLVLSGRDKNGLVTEIEFSNQNGEELLAALVSVLGQSARQRTGDKNLKKVMPVEWWEIHPHPAGDGVLFSWRMPGGFEMTFHLHREPSLRFEETLATLLGLNTPSSPPSSRQ